MKLKLKDEHFKQFQEEEQFILDGDTYTIHSEKGETEHTHGITRSYVMERTQDVRKFWLNVEYVRYGHKDYGFEMYAQDHDLQEVKLEAVTKYVWRNVND
ncbi:hypothetical protein COE80_19390 [Bacillus pseudomycoides]|uniref:hypothetical protein n=1 Tax=Bacillus pseudomycoides TaxID=64104 RepID=UPI000BFCD369|nr:hypothetical protein [Bacillus pseudomycoides]PHB23078.1 hypothetical protein COE80_19390 [Bacillus pseudomycoides]PHE37607.1 hypothetical protein COF51_16355 [Bacillus pseudomycoides]